MALLLLGGCANIGTPSGGMRDEQPPLFLHANPAPGTRNFHGNKIVLTFDELVNVKDAFSKVVISPPGAVTPRVSSQGRHVIVNFPDTLFHNTTYTIDFGSAIEDNNEGNVLENFAYTFSTGDTLDSLRISGMVLSAENLEPMQGKIVGVHRNLADSALLKSRFDRVARTDDRGRFSIEGLSPGDYRIYAVDDVDNNYLWSSADEEMAFYQLTLSPYVEEGETTDSIYNLKYERLDTVVKRSRTIYQPNNVLLRNFKTDRRQQYVASSSRTDSTRFYIKFGTRQPTLPEMQIVGAPDMKNWYALERNATNDSLTLWLTKPSLIKTDTLRLAVRYQKLDSLQQYVPTADTLRFITEHPRAIKKDDKKKKHAADTVAPPIKHLGLQMLSQATLDIGQPIVIEAETPIATLDTLKLHLEEKKDTLWMPAQFPLSIRQNSLSPRRWEIPLPRNYGVSYRLTADSIAMEGLYGLHTAPLQREIKVKGREEYSSLTVNLQGLPADMPAFVELLGANDAPQRRESVEGARVTFADLQPGKYYMRLYLDANGNGVFDTGDYIGNRQPDISFYYPKQLTIKQNWEKEESWNPFATPVDKQKPYALLKNKPSLKKGEKAPKSEEEEEE